MDEAVWIDQVCGHATVSPDGCWIYAAATFGHAVVANRTAGVFIIFLATECEWDWTCGPASVLVQSHPPARIEFALESSSVVRCTTTFPHEIEVLPFRETGNVMCIGRGLYLFTDWISWTAVSGRKIHAVVSETQQDEITVDRFSVVVRSVFSERAKCCALQ